MIDTPSQETLSVEALVSEIADEFMARLDRGERPDVEDYAARHPALTHVLRQILPALELVRLSPSGNATTARQTESAVGLAGCLGDYRILREVGRGGMGVVYEAEQISLDRRVALKVLPFAAALDARQLQRFKNEAQAAAHLHHHHIVPVYAVGCERGVHYYAMQFIDGQPLTHFIEQMRQQAGLQTKTDRSDKSSSSSEVVSVVAEAPAPTIAVAGSTTHSLDRTMYFRQVAQWGAQAAEALEYAHQMGIIHRDIKPANLIIDERGQLWITDFGLAHSNDTKLTLTGDVVGTLRYMSPEQALGRGPVDPRADIYSLGATLYELLTLQPVFAGRDRRELLRQIAFAEAPAPRRTRRQVPVELETVILKALAKEPESRYGSAQELADDLRRFLDDRPIQARRPSLAQRGRKWLRRHKAAVTAVSVTAVVLLSLAVIGLAITSLRIAEEETRTRDALARTEKQRGRAETNFQKVLDGVENLLLEVNRERWPDVPQLDKVRGKLLENARLFYQNFLDEAEADPARQPEAARLGACVAKLDYLLGRFPDSQNAQARAGQAFEKLLVDFPDEYRYPSQLADLLLWAGQLARNPAEAEGNIRRAIALREKIPPEYSGIRHERAKLGKTYHDLGYLLSRQPQRAAEAEQPYRKALEIQRQVVAESPPRDQAKAALAATLNSFGLLLRMLGRPKEAEGLHREALTVCAELARDQPGWDGRLEVARAHNHLAMSLWLLDRRPEALGHVRQGLALHRQAAAEVSIAGAHAQELAATYRILASMLNQIRQDHEAEDAYRQALELSNHLAKEFPTFEDSLRNQIMAHFALASFLTDRGRLPEGKDLVEQLWRQAPPTAAARNHFAWLLVTIPDVRLRDADRAVTLAQDAVREVPGDGAYWNTLGVAHYRAGAWSAAQEALEKSMQLRQGGDSYDWFVLAMIRHQGGDAAQARRWFDQAVAWMDKNRPNDPELRSFRAEAAALLAIEPFEGKTKTTSTQR